MRSEFAPDFVAAYTAATRLCDALTPRPDVERALDVGTGSGVHALLAARHAKQVIATDVNLRALAFTELNAALNGIRNVEVREGSLFEPVEGETFDLITCNAPYVVSPETRWAYRDGGFAADEVSERVVKAAASHLNDGGYAALLVSWLGHEEAKPDGGRSPGSRRPTATPGSCRSGAGTAEPRRNVERPSRRRDRAVRGGARGLDDLSRRPRCVVGERGRRPPAQARRRRALDAC